MSEVITEVQARVAAALRLAGAGRSVVLAVSGGRDSVVLLDAVLAAAPARLQGVATFDHATGPAARDAVRHVLALGRAAGVRVWAGRAEGADRTEASWREARWRYLRQVAHAAAPPGAPPALVATGHTADDQLETTLMRVLRGAGARGLAGMAPPAADVVRPLLHVSRAAVSAYAAARDLVWCDDPGNASSAHLRNRVRRALLPAVARARPELARQLAEVAEQAAAWRAEAHAAADAVLAPSSGGRGRSVAAPVARLGGYDNAALAVLWPALAARAGVVLDRRGTARLVEFTIRCVRTRNEGRIPLGGIPIAGGAEVVLERVGTSPERAMVVRPATRQPSRLPRPAAIVLTPERLANGVAFGPWRLAAAGDPLQVADTDPWRVSLDGGCRYVVRTWRPGDRMRTRLDGPARRVKRVLADRRVPTAERPGWPVVVALCGVAADPWDPWDGEIVWIPGVCRSAAAPARPGVPGFVLHCQLWTP